MNMWFSRVNFSFDLRNCICAPSPQSIMNSFSRTFTTCDAFIPRDPFSSSKVTILFSITLSINPLIWKKYFSAFFKSFTNPYPLDTLKCSILPSCTSSTGSSGLRGVEISIVDRSTSCGLLSGVGGVSVIIPFSST